MGLMKWQKELCGGTDTSPPPPSPVLTQARPNTATRCFRIFGLFLEPSFCGSNPIENWLVALCRLQEASVWVAKCWCSCNATCSCGLGCVLACRSIVMFCGVCNMCSVVRAAQLRGLVQTRRPSVSALLPLECICKGHSIKLCSPLLCSLQAFVPHAHSWKPTGVAVSHCVIWYQSWLILIPCQICYHSRFMGSSWNWTAPNLDHETLSHPYLAPQPSPCTPVERRGVGARGWEIAHGRKRAGRQENLSSVLPTLASFVHARGHT